MPNHFHGILEIVGTTLVVVQNDDGKNNPGQPQGNGPLVVVQNDETPKQFGQPKGVAPTMKTIGQMMDAFKSITTVEYIRGVKILAWPPLYGKLWQRNYYEHIIRNRQSYQNISRYIINNPVKWRDNDFFQT